MSTTATTLRSCVQIARSAFPAPAGGSASRDAALYLAHTGHGHSLRALAGAAGTHPSTVLRAVRRIEQRRDDPLFERLIGGVEAGSFARAPEIKALGGAEAAGEGDPAAAEAEVAPAPADCAEAGATAATVPAPSAAPSEGAIRRAAKSALRRLGEPGAFLLVAEGAGKAGVFCAANGHRKPIALLALDMAAEFLRRDWIAPAAQATASVRYRITEPGRKALKRILAEEAEAKAKAARAEAGPGAPGPFAAQHGLEGTRVVCAPEGGGPVSLKVNMGESPLGWLARRKGPDGTPFLGADEVEAGERLREDFERAQVGPSVAQDWRRFLTPVDLSPRGAGRGPAEGPRAARERVTAALDVLGPGLADVALRVCCFLEGLEACEKRMGWSARSGKVVLKIALQRLSQHYGLTAFRE